MHAIIHPRFKASPGAPEAADLLRACVHCGFCHSACPTYRLLGDELDSPRGRIYLIKNLLETGSISDQSRQHLDLCLTCRACETACPSGVRYGALLDIARPLAEASAPRGFASRIKRWLVRLLVPRRHLFTPLLRVGQALRPFLPPSLKQKIPPLSLTRAKSSAALASGKAGRVPDGKRPLPAEPAGAARSAAGGQAGPDALLLGGCVQTPATPNVNRALQELLAHLGIKAQIIDIACCGSLDYHLAAPEAAKARMRQVMAAVAPYPGLPVISSATGCALTLKDYGEIFKAEPEAREAAAFSRRLVEASEFLAQRPLRCTPCKVAVHTPCTLQHGMQQGSQLEALLAHAGFTVLPVQDSHLCCGSAGAYSLLQPKIAARLRAEKLAALTAPAPEVIVTANIGCHLHLAAASPVPVLHWAELLAPRLLPS